MKRVTLWEPQRRFTKRGRYDDLKERLETDVVVSAGFAAVLALCVVMFVGLYNWSRYPPIFPPDAAGSPIEEAIPWSQ
jgi:hypothetical protein